MTSEYAITTDDGEPLYEYTITFDVGDALVLEAADAGHAYSEMIDDPTFWPSGATVIASIVRGKILPYGTEG
jgi:hypothetical protein